jgi:hypothetical protein
MLCRLETFGQALDQLQRNRAMLTAAIEARDRELVEACAKEADETALSFRNCRIREGRPVEDDGECAAIACAALIRRLIPKEDSRG